MTHVTRITKAGATHPIEPQSVVLLDPATGAAYSAAPGASASLTDGQLRATPVPVLAQTRTCLGIQQIVGLSTSTAASLPSIPAGAVTAEIQADGGSIRVRRDGVAPTATMGCRLDDGVDKTVDSTLADVRLIALSANTNVQIAYFNRV